MSTARLVLRASAIVVLALTPRMATAQLAGAVVFTPYVGAFVPTNDLATGLYAGKQQPAVAYGANASAWLNDRFALEAGLAYTQSDIKGTLVAARSRVPGSAQADAHVWLGSVKLMTQVMPSTSRYNLRFGIGPAVVTRSGSVYKANYLGEYAGLTDIGAAMSLCTRIHLTPLLGLRVRAENFLYQSKLRYDSRLIGADNADIAYDSKLQNDLVFSIGLQLMSRK